MEQADFELKNLSEENRKLVRPGAIFYFSALAEISFSDVKWTQKDLDAATAKAKRLSKALGLKKDNDDEDDSYH